MTIHDQNINKTTPTSTFEMAVAGYLSGPVSKILSVHRGNVKLSKLEGATAVVELGGGCRACPSSNDTLTNIVLRHLQDRFGDELIQQVTLDYDTPAQHV